MRVTESRSPNGPGYLILRHRDYDKGPNKFTLEMRPSLLGVELTERKITGVGSHGHYVYDEEKTGDIVGALCWPADTKKRAIPAWSFAWASVLAGGSDAYPMIGQAVSVSGEPAHGGALAWFSSLRNTFFPGFGLKPGQSDKPKNKKFVYVPDLRFKKINPLVVGGGNKRFPKNTPGITLCLSNEAQQQEVFFPILSGDLVCVQEGGDKSYSSLVYDTTKDNELDPSRYAPLHSTWWVMEWPLVTDATKGSVGGVNLGKENSLAWFIGNGGAIIGPPAGPDNIDPVVALISSSFSGILDLGGKKDKHSFGKTGGKGYNVNAGHIPANAYFIKRGVERPEGAEEPDGAKGEFADGPIDFGGGIKDEILDQMMEYEHPVRCHLEYWHREKSGKKTETKAVGPGGEVVEIRSEGVEKGDSEGKIFHDFGGPSGGYKRLGKWRFRSSCSMGESEDEGEDSPEPEPMPPGE